MTEVTIVGKLLDKPEERDAIHIAVAPVIAGEPLQPGQHIGLQGTDTETATSEPSSGWIGIVDPFLPHLVNKGDRFWMFLYPNTITSLKHQWTHPAFGPEVFTGASKNPAEAATMAASEQWLRDFI